MPSERILSEVTGTVWQVPVQPGQRVAVDDTLVIVDSMKMEIPIVATCAGIVSSLLVAEGDDVSDGQHVATLDR